MAWRTESNQQDSNPQQNLGSVENPDFEAAAAATEGAGVASGAPDGVPAAETGPDVHLPSLDPALIRGLSTSFARFPFTRLADQAKDPNWIPPDETLNVLGGHVEACGKELLEKFLPAVALKYANVFPATLALLEAYAAVLFMQWTVVMRAKVVELQMRAAQGGSKTVTVQAREVPLAAPPMAAAPAPAVPQAAGSEIPRVEQPGPRVVSDSEPYSI